MKAQRVRVQNQDLIECSSDWHQNPYGLGPGVDRFIHMARREGATLIGDGDLLDMVIFGADKFKNCQTINDLKCALGGYPFIYVAGNHDPDYMVRQVLGDVPNIIIVNSCDIDNWHFEHGDRLAVDWSWLRPFYLWLAKVAPHICPKAWLKFCEWRKWKRPGTLHNPSPTGTETEQYNDMTGIVWGNALKEAEKSHLNFCIGHTHDPKMILSSAPYGTVIDDGDLNDGSYVQIQEGNPSIKWLT